MRIIENKIKLLNLKKKKKNLCIFHCVDIYFSLTKKDTILEEKKTLIIYRMYGTMSIFYRVFPKFPYLHHTFLFRTLLNGLSTFDEPLPNGLSY